MIETKALIFDLLVEIENKQREVNELVSKKTELLKKLQELSVEEK